MRRFEIRRANELDNAGLLELTRQTPMSGRIRLRIDRDPDFFALARHRGDSEVFVAVREERVIASFSVTLTPAWVGGRQISGAYIADLKAIDRDGARALQDLLATVLDHLRAHDVDVAWCVVADGNDRVVPFLSGRHGMPPFASAGTFIVDELLSFRIWRWPHRYAIEEATGEAESLHDRFARTRELATPSGPPSQHALGHYVARSGSRIVATLELFDPTPLKRNLLLGAPLPTRALLAAGRAFGLPRVGEAVRLAYIRDVACDDDHPGALAALVDHARLQASRRGFTFTSIGLHERDPLRTIVAARPRFTFRSHLYVAGLSNPALVDAVKSGVPVQDYSWV